MIIEEHKNGKIFKKIFVVEIDMGLICVCVAASIRKKCYLYLDGGWFWWQLSGCLIFFFYCKTYKMMPPFSTKTNESLHNSVKA